MKSIWIVFFSILFSFSLCAQWVQTNGPEGAHAFDFEVIDGKTWVGTQSGLYISSDEGDHWSKVDDMFENKIVYVQKFFQEGNEVLMVTSEVNEVENVNEYNIYRSVDLGVTWSKTDAPNTIALFGLPIQLFRMYGYLFFQSFGRIFRSNDNGSTWEELTDAVGESINIVTNGAQIIASGIATNSISYDFGDSWSILNSTGTSSKPFLENSLIIAYSVNDSIEISEDLGVTWSQVSSPIDLNYGVTFKRGASGKLYLLNDLVYVSEDNGYTWELAIFDTPNDAPVLDMIELSDGEFLFCSKRGIFQTAENGSIWFPSHNNVKNNGAGVRAELSNGDILASSTSGYFRSPNAGENLFLIEDDYFDSDGVGFMSKGDSLLLLKQSKFSPSSSVVSLSIDNLNTIDSIGFLPDRGRFIRNGDSFYLITSSITYKSEDLVNWSEFLVTDPVTGEQLVIYDIHHTDEGALLASVKFNKLYRSVDGGVTWEFLMEREFLWPYESYFYSVNEGIVWVTSSEWYHSTDDGISWEIIAMEGIPRTSWGALPDNLSIQGDVLYCVDNLAVTGIYVSTDYGANWQSYNDGISDMGSTGLFVTNDYLYAGIFNHGLYRRGSVSESVGGFVYNDLNNNGFYETNEPPLNDILIEANPGGLFTKTNSDGFYAVYSDVSSDTIRAVPFTPYTNIRPEYHLASQSGSDLDFGIHFIPDMDDISVTLTNVEPFRPGFDNSLVLTVSNVGTTILSPTVKMALNNELSFLSASLDPTQIDGDTLFWTLPTLAPFASQDISIDLNLSVGAVLGSFLTIKADALPIANDQDPTNNNYSLVTEVVGAYDPNDKQVEPAGIFTPEQAANGDRLFYTIRFQNTGTFYAQNVRIVDTLTEKLDISSFRLLSASHSVEWNVRGENVLEFVFENIILPDSTSNEPASHGFVKFSVLPSSNLALGDNIDNFVDIYFDFNEPVRTNTAMTVFDINTASRNFVNEKQELLISPNPAADYCWLSIKDNSSETGMLKLYDLKGILIKEEKIRLDAGPVMLKLNDLAAGLYSVQVVSNKKVYAGQVIVP